MPNFQKSRMKKIVKEGRKTRRRKKSLSDKRNRQAEKMRDFRRRIKPEPLGRPEPAEKIPPGFLEEG